MTLIIGARCQDGVVLAADRRRLAKYEKGPETNKLFQLACGVALAGAGDDAVLNEARILIDRRIKELQGQSSPVTLFDVVEVTASIVNELVGYYRDRVEESFGYVLVGLEKLSSGSAKLYTIFGAGFSEVPWACLGSGSSYARPFVELILADGALYAEEASRTMATLFTLVSNVQTTVGDGVDICIVRDGQGIGQITHLKEVSLEGLRFGLLKALGIQHSGSGSETAK
jgi:20S proteasome alpha/beta subunit